MNESFEKADFAFLPERTAKTAWKRGCVGNSQEKEMAPISGSKAPAVFLTDNGSVVFECPPY